MRMAADIAPNWQSQYRERIETVLGRRLPGADVRPLRLHQAMRYGALGGGKRIRPLLVYATGHALGLAPGMLDAPAAAVELMHAYSLVHDDLPAMDDDDLRRGRPTTHRAFDEATAILAGDALQVLAFDILAEDPLLSATPPVPQRHGPPARARERHARHGRRPGDRPGGHRQTAHARRSRGHASRARPAR